MRFLTRLVIALALLAYLAYALIYFNFALALFSFPFDYDQGEGFELYDTLLHVRGEWPYRDPNVYPYYTSIYPPVFHLVVAPLVWAFGPQMWTGRLVSFQASLVVAGTIALAVHRQTRRGWLAGLSGLAFLASNYVYHIGPLFRQHMFMVMLETLTIVTLSSSPDNTRSFGKPGGPYSKPYAKALVSEFPGTRRLVAGLTLLLLAGFTKQLAISTAAAAFCWLFLQSPRRALLSGLLFAGAFLAFFLGLNWVTGGQWWLSTVLANVNPTIPGQLEMLFRQWFSLHYVLVLPAAARAVYETYFGRISIYTLWVFFSVAIATLSGKFGAGESYFVTSVAAACILSGIAFADLLDRSQGWRPQAALAVAVGIPLLYLWQARLVLHLPTTGAVFEPAARLLRLPPDRAYYDSQGYTQLGRPPDQADVIAGRRLAAIVASAPQPVLSEEAGFPLAAGKQVVSNPFPLLVMYEAGLFDPAELIRQIDSQSFGVVIFRAQFYPPPVLQAVGQSYEPWQEIEMNGFTYRVLRPRE